MSPRQVIEQPTEPRRPVRRIVLFFLAFGFAIAVIIGLTALLIYNSAVRPRREGRAVLAGVIVRPFVTLPNDNLFPMGLAAAPDGRLYLTLFGTGAIMQVDAQGNAAPWAGAKGKIHAGGSIAFGPDQTLYVVDFSTTDPRAAVGTLRRITPDGKVGAFGVTPTGQPLTLPLFSQMVFAPNGNLYVTDPSSARIWQIAPSGSGTIWWTAPALGNSRAQPTGIAYDTTHNALVIGDAGTGSVYRLALDGPAGNPLVLYRQAGAEVQSVVVDAQGHVLVSIWDHDNGQLARLESDGRLTLLGDSFRAPTAILFRDNRVYVANSDLLGLVPPLFGVIPSPLRAKPPFTVDVVDLSAASVAPPTGTPASASISPV